MNYLFIFTILDKYFCPEIRLLRNNSFNANGLTKIILENLILGLRLGFPFRRAHVNES